MLVSVRRILLVACCLLALAGIMLLFRNDLARIQIALIVVAAGLIGLLVVAMFVQPPTTEPLLESDDITELSAERRRELMRGTSKTLREMPHRYSVRLDAAESRHRRCFAAEVNTIRLGFIPAIITDNSNDRQGYGYVAFVHDGKRWRGPGLPCPDDQAEAVRHAGRCVSPLATEEETHFEESKG